MRSDELTPTELRNMLVQMLVGVTADSEDQWYDRIGKVEVVPLSFNPNCNWRVAMTSSCGDRRAFDHAIKVLREHHPYVKV